MIRMKKIKFVMAGLLSVTMLYGCGASTGGTKAESDEPVVALSKAQMAAAISVSKRVAYGADSAVPEKVRKECVIDKQLPDFIETYASKNNIAVVQKDGTVSSKDKGKVLVVEFSDIVGSAGGVFSGAKAVAVKGELFENGKKIGSFKGRRSSGGGAVFGYKGTCSILGRCVKALGKDISDWLVKPTMNARLGEM
jgi:hypothetical protein